MRQSLVNHRWTIRVRPAPIVRLLLLFGIILIGPGWARAQTWNGSASDLWSNASNWTPNTVPNSSSASVVITNTTNNPVLIDISPTIANLTLGNTTTNDSLTQNNGQSLTIAGGTSAGSLAIATGSTFTLGSTGSDTDLILAGTTGSTITLSGGGTLALSNNFNNRIYSTSGDTLVNSAGNTIQGSGQIGINNGGYAFTLNNQGTIDANHSTPLQVAPSNAVTNTGTLEATAGGTLNLGGTFSNSGGVIQSVGSGSTVNLGGTAASTINGGTLTTSGGGVLTADNSTLNGVTISSGSTLTLDNGAAAVLQGTITNHGTIAQTSSGSDTDIQLSGAVTLSGGTLSMSGNFNNRIYGITGSDSLNNSGTIQGSGQIGINNGGFAFTLTNNGTIDANLSSASNGALSVAPTNTVTNNGTLEATAGGTLNLGGTFNNASGVILSSGNDGAGTNSTVNLGGTAASTINGGTLTTSGTGVLTLDNSTLNGVTISSGSTVTLDNGATTVLQGTNTNHGTIAQNSTGSNTDIQLSGAVTLSGGTLSMSSNFNNRIYGPTGTESLVNDAGSTIQGSGQIGINNGGFAFTLTNNGTIDANQSAAALQVAPTTAVTNSGTLEATAGGTLVLTGGTFNNTSTGLILATGSGSIVDLAGSTITGGTLTTTSAGVIQNNGTATIDGTTSAPTISAGSTLTLDNGTTTILKGTIINHGTIAQNSSGGLSDMQLSGPVTLNGTGALVMSNNFNNRIYGITNDAALTNGVNHTIEGAGQLGINNGGFAFTLTNNGTILANQPTTLEIAPTGTTTNNGTFQANSGSTLFMNGTLTNYNPTTSTLTGGTYNAFSGTIEISQASASGGQVIATNAATILLDGASAKIADGSGADILRTFLSTNTAAGRFTIQDEANLTTASTGFSNAGTVNIGANSTFTVGGTNDYIQSGGTTTLVAGTSGLTVAAGHSVDINGGTLQGVGTITGNMVNNGGTVMPGMSGVAGVLTVTGNYTDPPSSHLFIQIGGPSVGNGLSQLDIGGTANLNNGTLDVSLINGFTPTNGELFTILTSGGLSGQFNDNTIVDGRVTFTVEYSPAGFPNDVVLDAHISGAVPEPASLAMLAMGMTGVGACIVRRSRAARRR
jgi:hypothetical protein